MKKLTVKALLMAGIIAFSANIFADPVTTPSEEKEIELGNDGNNIANDKTLQVPVTATVNNGVVNVQFTGTVPHATVRVNNALTGATVGQQSMSATAGTVSMIPVSGLTMGTITVTNNLSGASVSGDFTTE
ncbi:MAG: DUF3244 domain-containing protein [Bacteroidaceae bacterium]|nr:DUF3244 domain-containing protein [Bacteroidaceae bacterium]